jgi:hypothetical protein
MAGVAKTPFQQGYPQLFRENKRVSNTYPHYPHPPVGNYWGIKDTCSMDNDNSRHCHFPDWFGIEPLWRRVKGCFGPAIEKIGIASISRIMYNLEQQG